MIECAITNIEGVKVLQPKVLGDNRGSFMELWNEQSLREKGIKECWVQDNISTSVKGVLRGVHTSLLHPQAKIVSCLKGMIWDVAVDARPDSETFGRWHGELLTEDNHKQLYLPEGVAHGFLSLTNSMVWMKVNTHYTSGDEVGFMWNDPSVGIDWPTMDCDYIFADKDLKWGNFGEMIGLIKKHR